MGPSQTSQAIRRSSRLQLEIPVQVTSLDGAFPYSEQCITNLVNAHGCGLISPRALADGIQVRIEIVSAKRHTIARVTEVVPLGGDPETWLVGLELDIPGNFWGIEYAPSDWKIEEMPEPISPRADTSPAAASKPAAARRWRLTDISPGACYLESAAPFPVGTSVLVSVRALDTEYLLDGVVRASYPQTGMGVAFAVTSNLRQRVEELIRQLTTHREVPRVLVGRKEGQQTSAQVAAEPANPSESSDPLLDLVLTGPSLTIEEFLGDLRAQRLGKRRDPRIEIKLPVLLTGIDSKGRPLDQRVTTVNISRRGALLEGIHGVLSPGAKISLARGTKKEEFCVTWVMDDATPAGSRIGVAALDPHTTFWDAVLEPRSESGLEAAGSRPTSGETRG